MKLNNIILALLFVLYPLGICAQNIDPNNDGSQYAWGENVGWCNLEPGGDGGPGVDVATSGLTGYMYCENIGWVNFSPTTGGGVTVDSSTGDLDGFAWSENGGWVNFSPTNGGGVSIDLNSGEFSGFAWSKNYGWINFAPNGVPVVTSWENLAPIVYDVETLPVPIGSEECTVTATVDDTERGNSNIVSADCQIDQDSWVSMSAMVDPFDNPVEDVTVTSTAPSIAGVFNVCVHGTDGDGNISLDECTLLAVYDPSAGFVTGAGWIYSPEYAYSPDTSLTGKATFGFVSKYKKGATTPSGVTEFQFRVADLNFHSDNYDWLVIAGAKAMYKGKGTINGEGEYNFILSAIDADLNPALTVDRFRIRIWQEEIDGTEIVKYDNALGDDNDNAMTDVGGGSIVIHTSKK